MKMKKRFLSILLSLVMVLGLMPGMSLTAYAATETYTKLMNDKTVVKFNNYDWYIIADNSTAVDAGTVTLLAADTRFGMTAFDSTSPLSNAYISSTVKGELDALTEGNGPFASVKDAIADTNLSDVNVTGAKLYLLSTSEAGPYANFNFTGVQDGGWWLRSQGTTGYAGDAAYVNGESGVVNVNGTRVENTLGVRPALKLNLSSVIFSSESNAFSLKQTIAAENVTVTYGDTDKKVSASVTKPATSGGAISYTVKTGSEDFIAVDSTTGALTIKKVPSDGRAYVIVTAAESGNYGKTTKEVTVTINKANAAPATVTANNCTYDGAEKPLVTVTGTVTGGTMQYALGTKNAATGTYSASIPTATDAGTYYVWYKAAGDSDHADSKPACVTATISQAQQSQTPEEQITINKKPTLKKPKPKKNKATITWNKLKRKTKAQKKIWKQIKQIEVEWSTDPSFPKEITSKKTLGKRKTKTNITGLQRKTIYFVRVRYSDGNGGYSRWSKVKRFKTK